MSSGPQSLGVKWHNFENHRVESVISHLLFQQQLIYFSSRQPRPQFFFFCFLLKFGYIQEALHFENNLAYLFLTSQSSEETFCFWPSPHLALFAAYGISSLSLRFYYILLSFKKIFYLKKLLTVSPIPRSGNLTKFSHMSISSLELLAKNS